MRPYYIEHLNEWITHEVWAADGTEIALMKLDPAPVHQPGSQMALRRPDQLSGNDGSGGRGSF